MKDKTKKFAIGAVVAGAVGYITGILTAPKSGKETRKDIKEGAQKARSEAEKQLKNLHSELDELLERGKKTVGTLQSKAKDELADAVKSAGVAKDKARTILSALHEGTAEDKDLDKAVNEVKKSIDHLKKYLVKHDSAGKAKD